MSGTQRTPTSVGLRPALRQSETGATAFGGLRAPRLLALGFAIASFAVSARSDESPTASSRRFVHEGVAVQFSVLPAAAGSGVAPQAGEPARVRFTITDVTSEKPLSGLHPAAWLSRKTVDGTAMRPQTAAEKVRELLGGSIFSRSELDLNTYRVLVLNDDATVSVVDPQFGFGGAKRLALIRLPGVGADWILTPDGNRLFVSVPDAGKVAVIDPANWQVVTLLDVGSAPRRLAVQPDAHYTWVDCESTDPRAPDGVAVIATNGAEVVARIATGRGPHQIMFSADSHWAFVVNGGGQTISVVDVRTLRKTRGVPLGCTPTGAAYSNASEAVYLTDGAGGKIVVFDAVKHEIVARVTAETGIGQVKFAPGDRFGLVAVPARNEVLVLDTATNRIVQRANLDGGPDRFAFSDDMAFVVSRNSAIVSMFPLPEIGREGQPLAVAEFPGGDGVFGARPSQGETVMAVPGEPAVVVANPADKTVYYYMEGMAAPLGNFSNDGRQPRAVLVLDRSLKEISPGEYETTATLPPAGDYDAVFFLNSPRITHCFDASIQPVVAGKSPSNDHRPIARTSPVATVK